MQFIHICVRHSMCARECVTEKWSIFKTNGEKYMVPYNILQCVCVRTQKFSIHSFLIYWSFFQIYFHKQMEYNLFLLDAYMNIWNYLNYVEKNWVIFVEKIVQKQTVDSWRYLLLNWIRLEARFLVDFNAFGWISKNLAMSDFRSKSLKKRILLQA